jgi:hypothetical protein
METMSAKEDRRESSIASWIAWSALDVASAGAWHKSYRTRTGHLFPAHCLADLPTFAVVFP